MLMDNGFDPARGKGLIKACLKTVAATILDAANIIFFFPRHVMVPKVVDNTFLQAAIAYTVVVENVKQQKEYIDQLWADQEEEEEDN